MSRYALVLVLLYQSTTNKQVLFVARKRHFGRLGRLQGFEYVFDRT